MLWNCIAVGCGGAFGSVCRYLLGLIPVHSNEFPFITLFINLLGAFLIGLVIAFAGKHGDANPHWILFLQVGFCGGFTTFSTFSNETFLLIQNGKFLSAAVYILLSVFLCIGAVWAGRILVR